MDALFGTLELCTRSNTHPFGLSMECIELRDVIAAIVSCKIGHNSVFNSIFTKLALFPIYYRWFLKPPWSVTGSHFGRSCSRIVGKMRQKKVNDNTYKENMYFRSKENIFHQRQAYHQKLNPAMRAFELPVVVQEVSNRNQIKSNIFEAEMLDSSFSNCYVHLSFMIYHIQWGNKSLLC